MAIDPTRFSRLSVGFLSSNESLVDRDPADTGVVLSVTGGAAVGIVAAPTATTVGVPGEIRISNTSFFVCDSNGSFRVVDTTAL